MVSLNQHTLRYSSLLFVDTIAHVCGFCFLFKQVLQNQNALSENRFTLSAIVYCLILSVLQTSNTDSSIKMNRKEMAKLKFTSPVDRCLCAVSVHKYRRTTIHNANRKSHNWSSTIPSNASNNEEEIRFYLDESLEETLVKVSVNMFQKCYDLYFITLERNAIPCHFRIVSHFKALYYYRTGEYMRLLNTCNSILSREVFTSKGREHPQYRPGIENRDLFWVSVLFAFQTLFGNDVTCLTGLFALIDPSCYKEFHISEDKSLRFETNSFSTEKKFHLGKLRGLQKIHYVTRISSFFLVHYLKVQSLIQLHFPKSDILLALNDLKRARNGLVFEDILLLFVEMTLKRLSH